MAESTKPPENTAKKTTPPANRDTTGDRPSTLTAPQPGTPASAGTNPAGAAIRDAARAAEAEQLRGERDELRKLIGDAPTLEVLRAEVSALREAAARAGVTRTSRWTMSAGVAADLETVGYATDPTTGDAFVRDGDRVTVTTRTGETRTVDMPTPASPTATTRTEK